ncbi:MAG: hypothetical protein ACFFDW_00765 [Candidatus Thorarchaeota archaeon]
MEKRKIDLLGIGIELLAAYFLIAIINGIIGLTTLYPQPNWEFNITFEIYEINYLIIFCSFLPLIIGLCFIAIRIVKITKVMGGFWENKGIMVSSLSGGVIFIMVGMFLSITILSINSDWYEYYLIFPVSILIANLFMGLLLLNLESIQNDLIVMKGSKEEGKLTSKLTIIFAIIWAVVFIISTTIIFNSIGNNAVRVEMLETVNFVHLIIYGLLCFIATRTLRRKWHAFLKMEDLISKDTTLTIQG